MLQGGVLLILIVLEKDLCKLSSRVGAGNLVAAVFLRLFRI